MANQEMRYSKTNSGRSRFRDFADGFYLTHQARRHREKAIISFTLLVSQQLIYQFYENIHLLSL